MQPPTGAGMAPPPGSVGDPNALDTRLLDDPINVFRWGAGAMKRYAHQLPASTSAEVRQATASRVAWLEELGSRIDANHTDPVIMLALTRCALDLRLREAFFSVLQQVEEVTRAASAAAEAAGKKAEAPPT